MGNIIITPILYSLQFAAVIIALTEKISSIVAGCLWTMYFTLGFSLENQMLPNSPNSANSSSSCLEEVAKAAILWTWFRMKPPTSPEFETLYLRNSVPGTRTAVIQSSHNWLSIPLSYTILHFFTERAAQSCISSLRELHNPAFLHWESCIILHFFTERAAQSCISSLKELHNRFQHTLGVTCDSNYLRIPIYIHNAYIGRRVL